MFLSSLDLLVVAIYAIALFAIAQYVSREPKGTLKNTEDYFLAGKSLPWWAIGASLIAANISACLLYTSPSPRDQRGSRMPSSA